MPTDLYMIKLVTYLTISPTVKLQEVMVRGFRLGEGVDKSGVPTKILRINCSVDLEVDNKSRVFGLHLQQTTLQLAFQSFNLAISHVKV